MSLWSSLDYVFETSSSLGILFFFFPGFLSAKTIKQKSKDKEKKMWLIASSNCCI